MNKISLIGLGAMGSAIARALIDNRCELTVWNRSAIRTREIAALGAIAANDLEQAIEASPVILVCIHGYAATRSLLDNPETVALLRGRTLIQMSTGTPAEARAAEAWINGHGGRYLDCSIMVYPQDIGGAGAQLLVSGAEDVYRECARYIGCLGDDIRYLGAAVGAAAALDLAAVTRLVANSVAILYAIHLCESEGVSLQQFADLYPEGDRARHLASVVDSGNFDDNVAATVGTSIEVISAIRNLAVDLGINTELPDFLLGLYRRLDPAACHDRDNAALIDVFRAGN